MRKTSIIFFLTTALLLVLGHSVLPHNHISNVCGPHCISIKNTPTLTDIIKNSLTRDLGINHLEEYNGSQHLGFDYTNVNDSLEKTDFSYYYVYCLGDTISSGFSNYLVTQISFKPTHSRAPPKFH